jgi:hypothetical protein
MERDDFFPRNQYICLSRINKMDAKLSAARQVFENWWN